MANIKSINNNGVITAGMLIPGQVVNLGMTFAANVFTITAADGTALSTTNPGWVCVPSTTAGQNVALAVTSPVTFNDDTHASPTFPVNMGFGVTLTVDWAQDVPFFLYYVNEDNTAANGGFFFSRNPTLKVTPAAGYIHDIDAIGATADSQSHICGVWNDDAGKAAKPCVCIGSFRMRWDTTSDGWTVQTLNTQDGFGKFQEGVQFTFPKLQNGAGLNYLSEAGAVTTLAFEGAVASTFTYEIDLFGRSLYHFSSGTRSAADASATALYLHTPFVNNPNGPAGLFQIAQVRMRAAAATAYTNVVKIMHGQTYMQFANSSDTAITVAAFTDASDYVSEIHALVQVF